MSDRDRRGPGSPSDSEPDDEPIAALAAFVEPVSPGFLGRLRNRIHRRELGGEVVRLGWYAPFTIFMEFVTMIFGLLSSGDETGRDEEER